MLTLIPLSDPGSGENEMAPTLLWSHAEIDAWADARGIEIPVGATKADKLAAIALAYS